jgi:hypothetical protein
MLTVSLSLQFLPEIVLDCLTYHFGPRDDAILDICGSQLVYLENYRPLDSQPDECVFMWHILHVYKFIM